MMALIGVIGWFHVKLLADFLNLRRLSDSVPESLNDVVSEEDHLKAKDYHIDHARLDVLSEAAGLAALVGFWWVGGFQWLALQVQGLGWGSISSGLLILGSLVVASSLLNLPFEWYSTFKIEAAYGLNRTTPGTFVADRVKGLVMACALGGPLVAGILWVLANVQAAAFWAWALTSLFGLLMTWIAPRFLMPIFMKFTPMEPGELRDAILALARKQNFPVQEIYVVDGSRRSTKANAFFTGIGNTRRIALFDTLLATHSTDEIIAVLAHEIGHAKLGHVPWMITAGLLQSAAMFACLHFALSDVRFYEAFGVQGTLPALGLALFSIVWKPWSVVLDILHGMLSRKHEFQADEYAKVAIGTGEPLISALKKLSRDHLAHLTPHPFYILLHHSHPPVLQRIQALSA
ncbi:MAG: M48 family metallopeptidase [Verrucomicrobiaceae bacterium]|nr:M48 family metallopeptidase [Verrucomicrobiaceae bacterium]